MRTLLTATLIVLGLFPAPTEKATLSEPDRIVWAKSWKEAVAAAKAEGKPIMIHFSHDSESVCHEIARGHFRDEKLVKLSRKFICVVGCLSDHESHEPTVDDGAAQTCPRYGTCSCAEHRKTEVAARTEVLESNTATAPQFVFTDPELNVLVRRPFMLAPSELRELMERALEYYDPSLTPEEVKVERRKLLDSLLLEAKSDNAAKRKGALQVLARRDDPEVIRFFLEQTSSDVDEVKRNEALNAISEAQNPNCIGRLNELMGDRSVRIRMNATRALRNLGMSEAVPALIRAYGKESSSRGKALILRAAAACSSEKDVRKLIQKALKSGKSLVRTHAVRACLDFPPDDKLFGKITGLARGDTDKSVRAVACHAGTSLALSAAQEDGAVAVKVRSLTKRKLKKALKTVAAKDRDEGLRAYAAMCLEALAGDEDMLFETGIDDFHSESELLGDETDD